MKLTRAFDVALWTLLLIALARTTVLVRRRDTSEFDAVDISATIAIVIVAAIIGLLVLHPRSRQVLGSLRESSVILVPVYFVLAALTALWSLRPDFTVFRALEVLTFFAAMFVLIAGFRDWRNAERAMLTVLMTVTVLSFLQRALFVGLSFEGLHTNVYTVTAGMGFLYALGESFRADAERRRALRRWMVVFLAFAIAGTSAGSNIGIACGVLAMLPFLPPSRIILVPIGIACVAIIVVLGTSEEFLSSTLLSGRSIEDAQSLTGRMDLWRAYFDAFAERPLIGHGFAVVARLGDQFGTNATTNAHNGFIEALIGLGVFGFALLLIFSIRLVAETWKANRAGIAGGLGCMAALIMMMVNNNSKSILGGGYDPTVLGVFAMLAFFHVYTWRAVREQEAQRRMVREVAVNERLADGASSARP
ncbi:O-antigen ligase family protein [Aurantiacibacter hainanensis]|uniref:O-antigen ligase family protein n=1 Tax=Aurantiacibacter hainanensis TaxID=3076114 RepID=UPI0030C66330